MRYLCFVKMAEDVGHAPPELFEAMGKAMSESFASGLMLDAGGLYPLSSSTEIRLADGKVTTTDGPYSEAKEVVGGYSILQARSHAEVVENARRVIELHRQFWPGWEGSVEIRRITEPDQTSPSQAQSTQAWD